MLQRWIEYGEHILAENELIRKRVQAETDTHCYHEEFDVFEAQVKAVFKPLSLSTLRAFVRQLLRKTT